MSEMAGVWSLRILEPLWFESFLLIVRRGLLATRGRIFTVAHDTIMKNDRDTTSTEPIPPEFPADSQLHSPSSPMGGAAFPRYYRGKIYLRRFCYDST